MKQSQKQGERNIIGALGEKIAVNYLKKLKFTILDTNYLKKWGEIDVVTRGIDGKVRFVEVKAVSYETKPGARKKMCILKRSNASIARSRAGFWSITTRGSGK